MKADEPLVVFYSTDVAQKKNDLIDALVQYQLDKQVLDNAKLASAIPEVLRLNYERNVQSDINAIDRARKCSNSGRFRPRISKRYMPKPRSEQKTAILAILKNTTRPKRKIGRKKSGGKSS